MIFGKRASFLGNPVFAWIMLEAREYQISLVSTDMDGGTLSLYIYIFISIYLSFYVSMFLSIYLSMNEYKYLHISLFFLYIKLYIHTSHPFLFSLSHSLTNVTRGWYVIGIPSYAIHLCILCTYIHI